MALNPSNGSNLEQLALKGLIDAAWCVVCAGGTLRAADGSERSANRGDASRGPSSSAAEDERTPPRVGEGRRVQSYHVDAGRRRAVFRRHRTAAGNSRLSQRRRRAHLRRRLHAARRCLGHGRAHQQFRQLPALLLHEPTVPRHVLGPVRCPALPALLRWQRRPELRPGRAFTARRRRRKTHSGSDGD